MTVSEPLLSSPEKSLEAKSKRNVQKMFVYCAVMGLIAAITSGGVFDNYLYAQTGNNSTVGWAASLGGMAQMFAALPAGYICDLAAKSGRRTWLMNTSAGLGMIACTLNVFGFSHDYLPLLYVALVINGMSVAFGSPSSWSLFADSIGQGKRAEYMARITMVSTITTGVGPFLGMTMFYFMGNTWDVKIMHTILIITNVGLFFGETTFLGWCDVPSSNDGAQAQQPGKVRKVSKYAYLVPYIMFFNSMVRAVGAGMTVKFFPLFFANDYGFSPVQVQLCAAFVPLLMSPCIWLCERTSRVTGRIQAGLIFNLIAIVCLLMLAWLRWTPAVVFAFMLRGAIQNAVYPVDMSVVMDFVPSGQRGRWSSLESLTSMTWTGSALIGGYLCDAHDYRYAFIITAYVYMFATFCRLPLLFLVPRQEKFEEQEVEALKKQADLEEVVAHHASPVAPSPRM